ncbi:MAG: hypothetical protein JWP10_1076 [Nocardioidaceae bacterium]|nr:hypothetical protein [Nocardioidaceae bacterium]
MTENSIDPDGKGRPTPSRKEAEAARKQRMTAPVDKKAVRSKSRSQRNEARLKMRAAMETGDEKNLPDRERGPVRRFCRDFIDRRVNYAEFLLPLLVVILVLSFVPADWAKVAVFTVWSATIVGVLIDESLMIFGLRRQLKARFPNVSTKGAIRYAVLRSTQLRRFRLPKPQIKRGGKLQERY